MPAVKPSKAYLTLTHLLTLYTGAVLFSIFLIGWALGGVLFGIMADYVGRTKTLVFTIFLPHSS